MPKKKTSNADVRRRGSRSEWDERWCLIALRFLEPPTVLTDKQCEHNEAPGKYVVESKGEWCCFDPPTKLQALSWTNNKPERTSRVRWQCHQCGAIMPLADQLPKSACEETERAKSETTP